MKRILLLVALLGASSIALAAGSGLNQFTPPPGDTSVDFLHEVFAKLSIWSRREPMPEVVAMQMTCSER